MQESKTEGQVLGELFELLRQSFEKRDNGTYTVRSGDSCQILQFDGGDDAK